MTYTLEEMKRIALIKEINTYNTYRFGSDRHLLTVNQDFIVDIGNSGFYLKESNEINYL